MSYIWFWTFWHWSKESYRLGSLLRSPLHGVASHWDEWYCHEASESDRACIEAAGRNEESQRAFIAWLLRHWAGEADLRKNRLARRFVLSQLSQVHPFNQWAAFEKYRASYGLGGISAIVLAEGSAGESDDVRLVEALALPVDVTTPAIISDGFQADSIDLETPRQAAGSLLNGKGFFVFVALWLAAGRRSYPTWLKTALSLGWVAVAGLFLFLLFGPDPGDQLFLCCATLTILWLSLALVAVFVTGKQAFLAWSQGGEWRSRLDECQVRLRMDGGLTVKGASAGLPFCLNTLLSFRQLANRSWLWQRVLGQGHFKSEAWAATGVITADGHVKPVVLEPKVRACLQRDGVKHIFIPRQLDADYTIVNRIAAALRPLRPHAPAMPVSAGARLGFAAEEPGLRVHPCRHAAQALMRLGNLTSAPQMVLNAVAIAASVAMLLSWPDLHNILLPPPAPLAKAPSSTVPGWLWVSLDTKKPECFLVVLESGFWANRRAVVTARGGANGSVRAEIQLRRSPAPDSEDQEDGVVWVERRQRLLNREFVPGERIGRFDLSYLNSIAHD